MHLFCFALLYFCPCFCFISRQSHASTHRRRHSWHSRGGRSNAHGGAQAFRRIAPPSSSLGSICCRKMGGGRLGGGRLGGGASGEGASGGGQTDTEGEWLISEIEIGWPELFLQVFSLTT